MNWVTPPVLVGLGASVSAMAASTFTLVGRWITHREAAGWFDVVCRRGPASPPAPAGLSLSVAFASACVRRIAWGWLSDRCFASHATTLAFISGVSIVAIGAMAAGVAGPAVWLIVVVIGLCSIGWTACTWR